MVGQTSGWEEIKTAEAAHRYLFGEEDSFETFGSSDAMAFLGDLDLGRGQTVGDYAALSLNALARLTPRGGHRSPELRTVLTEVPEVTDPITDEALAGIKKVERNALKTVVAETFKRWEIARDRRRLGRLLVYGAEQTQLLVTEAAGAAADVAAGTPGIETSSKTGREHITKLLVYWGPGLIRQWFDGTAYQSWAAAEHVPDKERKLWDKEVLTPAFLRWAILHHIQDPLSVFERTREQLATVLGDESIADVLGCTPAHAAKAVSLKARLDIIKHHSTHPETAIKAYEATLTEEHQTATYIQLAAELGFSTERLRTTVPPGLLGYFATHYPDHMGEAVGRWLRGEISVNMRKDRTRDKKLATPRAA